MSEVLRILILEDVPTDAGLNEREVRKVIPRVLRKKSSGKSSVS